jgi:hypothetical protein
VEKHTRKWSALTAAVENRSKMDLETEHRQSILDLQEELRIALRATENATANRPAVAAEGAPQKDETTPDQAVCPFVTFVLVNY